MAATAIGHAALARTVVLAPTAWRAQRRWPLRTAAAGPLARLANRRRRLVDAASSWAMTVFVWHLAAWGLAYVAVTALGVAVPADVGPAWWAQRPLWLLAPAAVAIPLCRATRRFDRTAGAGQR